MPEKIERRGGLRVPKGPRTCVICGKTFWPNASGHKTCSPECRKAKDKKRHDEWTAKYLYAKRNVWVDKRCRICGKRFREKKFATMDNQQYHSECQRCRRRLADGTPWWEIKYPEVRVESMAAKRERKWREKHKKRSSGRVPGEKNRR